jgi:hypothetical protein
MIRTIAEQQGLERFYTYNKIEIVEIDGKRYVRKKRSKKVFYRGVWQHVTGARKIQSAGSVDSSVRNLESIPGGR